MKAIFIAVLLFFSTVAIAGDFRIWSGNDKVNPTAGTVLVTSGPVDEGAPAGTVMKVKAIVSSTATAGMQFQIRDGSGVPTTTIKYGVAANAPSDLIDFEVDIPNGHSFNIVNTANVTGTVHAHILARVISGL